MDWQPIETAPKDGRDVLLWSFKDGGAYVANYDEVNSLWLWTSYDLAGDQVVVDPTHWAKITEPEYNG